MATDISIDKNLGSSDQGFELESMGRPYGGKGIRCVSNTAQVAGVSTIWIQVLEDAVFSEITPVQGFSITGLTGVTLFAGTAIGVRASSFTLASGKVLSYEIQ